MHKDSVTSDMSKTKPNTNAEMTAERAMHVVLEAERNAKRTIKACEQEAEQQLQAARQKARRIDERVDNRITRIHLRCSRVVTDQVSALKKLQKEQAEQGHTYVVNEESVSIVVNQIADMLTGIKEGADTIPE